MDWDNSNKRTWRA